MNCDNKISVVLPCFNAENFIIDAISSILNQTYKNLELIVINDGSTDNSLSSIHSIAETDKRIKVISRDNKGLIYSLNEGINKASGEYIARMDADDISMPERFESQMEFLTINKLDFVGGAISKFYTTPQKKERKKFYPITNDEVVASILTLKSRIAHPTLLAKRDVFKSHQYNSKYAHAEDYALWLDIVLSGQFSAGNLPQVVLRYRSHPSQVHSLNKPAQSNAKRTAFLDMMTPITDGDKILTEKIYNFWQAKSFKNLISGSFVLKDWLTYLEQQSFFNERIKRLIYKRAFGLL